MVVLRCPIMLVDRFTIGIDAASPSHGDRVVGILLAKVSSMWFAEVVLGVHSWVRTMSPHRAATNQDPFVQDLHLETVYGCCTL